VISKSHRNAHPLNDLLAVHTKEIATAVDEASPVYASHPDKLAISVKSGDVLIGYSRLLHRAYTNNSHEERPLLTLWYIPNWDQLPENVEAGLQKFYERKTVDSDDNKEDTLIANLYGPSVITTIIKGIEVVIEQCTQYPFTDQIEFIVKVDKPLRFSLLLRKPQWSETTEFADIDNTNLKQNDQQADYLHIESIWEQTQSFTLTLRTSPKIVAHGENLQR
jgi:hypothetical protein